MRFEADKDIMDALVHIKNKTGVGRRGEATAGEPALAKSFWGMLYADDAGVVSQSPEQLRKMMGTIVVTCAAFDLIESQAKTEIMRLRTRGMPASTTIFSVEAAGQVYNQTDEFVNLGGNVNHIADLPSRSTGACATHGAASESSTLLNCTADRALPSSVCTAFGLTV